MAIKILYRDQRNCPVVVCDVCQDMIGNAGEGAVVFRCSAPENSKLVCLHVHKGECHDKAEEGIEDAGWEELGAHMAYIMSNLGIDLEAFKELDRSMALRREVGL